jgi:RHS repeat-associated protein
VFSRRVLLFVLLAIVGALAALPQTSGAQGMRVAGHPRQFKCTGSCPNPPPPSAIISPTGGTFNNPSLRVTITLCDSASISNYTVTLNGGQIVFPLGSGVGPAGCHLRELGTNTLTLSRGTNTLQVSVTSMFDTTQTGTASATYVYAQRGVRVVASAGDQTAPPSSSVTANFLVTNTGAVTDTFALTPACTGPSFVTNPPCTLPSGTSPLILTGGQTKTVSVSTTTGSIVGPNGLVTVRAVGNSSSTTRDSGFANVRVVAFPAGLDVVDVNPGVSFNRDACLAVSVAPRIAFQCGELRITHPLPSVRTYNKTRTPALIYNSRLAAPFMPINALLTIPAVSGTTLTSVTGQLKVWQHATGTPGLVASGTWPGTDWGTLSSPTTRRLQLIWKYGQEAHDGLYDYTFITTRAYGNNTTATDTASGQLILANRYTTPEFGNGWYLAGLEKIHLSDSAIVWIGGDGSTQLYTPCGTNNWCPWNPNSVFGFSAIPQAYVDGRDSITFDGTAYTRHVPHGGRVVFDVLNGTGYDTAAFDRLGHETRFRYDSLQRLDTIWVPVPSKDTAMYYAFAYNLPHQTFYLQQVSAPGPNGTRRLVTLTNRMLVLTAAAGQTQITDPDGQSVQFSYTPEPGGDTVVQTWDLPLTLNGRTDKRGTLTSFTYAPDHGMLASATIHMQATGADITHTFTTPGFGTAAPDISSPHAVIADSAFIVLHGPRSQVAGDSADTSRFWVDQMWQPIRVRDAHGYETVIYYGNLMFPTLPLRVEYPSQRVLTFIHADGRANVTQVIDSGTIVNGVVATTKATYDSLWDEPTLVIRPAGDSLSFAYDPTTGNRQYQQPGASSSRRVNFTYYPSNSLASGLLSQITPPVEGAQNVGYHFLYDTTALDNDVATITPLGIRSTVSRDGIGRSVAVRSPIDSLGDMRVDSTQWDVMDNAVVQISHAPAITHNFVADTALLNKFPPLYQPFTADSAAFTVTTQYDPDGRPLSVVRVALPDTAHIGPQETDFSYDPAGRTIRTTQHFGSPDSTLYDSTQYDVSSNVVATVSRRHHTTTAQYDALNRRIRRIVPAIEYPKDASLTVISEGFTDHFTFPSYPNCPDGTGYCIPIDTATFAYDNMGRMIEADNSDARISRAYNMDGTPASDTLRIRPYTGTDFSQHVFGLAFTYDLDLRRTSLTHPANLAPASASPQRYQYDGIGELQTLTDVLGNAFTYQYDNDGRIQHLGSSAANEHWAYDLDGRLHEKIDSTTNVTTANGWPAATLHDDIYSYDAQGKVVIARLVAPPEQITVLNGYSGLGALVDGLIRPLNDPGPGNLDHTEEYNRSDAFGNPWWRWSDIETVNGTSDSARTFGNYVYDRGTTRVDTTKSITSVPATVNGTQTLYDSSGNEHQQVAFRPVATTAKSWNAIHNFYDATQQLRAMDKQLCVAVAGTSGCEFSIKSLPDIPYFAEYRYDALGRRVFARTQVGVATCAGNFRKTESCQGFVERTVYDGDQILYEIRMPDSVGIASSELERDTGGVALYEGTGFQYGRVAYTHGGGIDDPVDILRMGFDTLFQGAQQIVPLPDWRGGFDIFTLAGGAEHVCTVQPANTTWQNSPGLCFQVEPTDQQYGAFHQDLMLPVASLFLPFWSGSLFSGRRDPTNQIFLRNRYYDPQTGRFTQEDPIGLAGGLNAYAFANGDPVNYSDPFGLCGEADHYTNCPHTYWLNKLHEMHSVGGKIAAAGAVAIAFIAEPLIDMGKQLIGLAPCSGSCAGMQLMLGAGGGDPAPDFVVNSSGEAVAIPDGATGPTPTKASGFQYTGGSGGKGMDERVDGVRIMDANSNQGRRVNYMNGQGQTVDPQTGQTISKQDPRGHLPF